MTIRLRYFLLVIVASWVVGVFTGYVATHKDNDVATAVMAAELKFRAAANARGVDLARTVVGYFMTDGPKRAIDRCNEGIEADTEVGHLWFRCSITAEFYDPATWQPTKTATKLILPTGFYQRVENGLDALDTGYQMRNKSVLVMAWNQDPEKPGARPVYDFNWEF